MEKGFFFGCLSERGHDAEIFPPALPRQRLHGGFSFASIVLILWHRGRGSGSSEFSEGRGRRGGFEDLGIRMGWSGLAWPGLAVLYSSANYPTFDCLLRSCVLALRTCRSDVGRCGRG